MTIQAFMQTEILRSKHTNGQLTACLLLNNSFFTPGWEEKLNGSWLLGIFSFAHVCAAKQQLLTKMQLQKRN